MIINNIDQIDDIVITLDSHYFNHIAHSIFWKKGPNHPDVLAANKKYLRTPKPKNSPRKNMVHFDNEVLYTSNSNSNISVINKNATPNTILTNGLDDSVMSSSSSIMNSNQNIRKNTLKLAPIATTSSIIRKDEPDSNIKPKKLDLQFQLQESVPIAVPIQKPLVNAQSAQPHKSPLNHQSKEKETAITAEKKTSAQLLLEVEKTFINDDSFQAISNAHFNKVSQALDQISNGKPVTSLPRYIELETTKHHDLNESLLIGINGTDVETKEEEMSSRNHHNNIMATAVNNSIHNDNAATTTANNKKDLDNNNNIDKNNNNEMKRFSLDSSHQYTCQLPMDDHPAPYTVVTADDVENRVWVPFDDKYSEWCLHYTKELEKQGMVKCLSFHFYISVFIISVRFSSCYVCLYFSLIHMK